MAIDSKSALLRTETISFKALKLRAGLALQAQGANEGGSKEEVQFLAAVGQKGVMVGPYRSGERIGLGTGAEYIITGFTGQYDFSFTAKVVQIFEQPFAYALLEYPATANARLVRSAMRMKTSRPAKATSKGHSQAKDVTLIDLSHCGAMVHSPTTLGAFGDIVNLALSFEFEGDPVSLVIPSTICHSYACEHDDGVNVGLAFKPNSKDV